MSTIPHKPDPNSYQHGGSHYKAMAIQVWDYVTANNIPYLEACAIKYVSRWRHKGGIEDLHKAIHFIEKAISGEAARLAACQPGCAPAADGPAAADSSGISPHGPMCESHRSISGWVEVSSPSPSYFSYGHPKFPGTELRKHKANNENKTWEFVDVNGGPTPLPTCESLDRAVAGRIGRSPTPKAKVETLRTNRIAHNKEMAGDFVRNGDRRAITADLLAATGFYRHGVPGPAGWRFHHHKTPSVFVEAVALTPEVMSWTFSPGNGQVFAVGTIGDVLDAYAYYEPADGREAKEGDQIEAAFEESASHIAELVSNRRPEQDSGLTHLDLGWLASVGWALASIGEGGGAALVNAEFPGVQLLEPRSGKDWWRFVMPAELRTGFWYSRNRTRAQLREAERMYQKVASDRQNDIIAKDAASPLTPACVESVGWVPTGRTANEWTNPACPGVELDLFKNGLWTWITKHGGPKARSVCGSVSTLDDLTAMCVQHALAVERDRRNADTEPVRRDLLHRLAGLQNEPLDINSNTLLEDVVDRLERAGPVPKSS